MTHEEAQRRSVINYVSKLEFVKIWSWKEHDENAQFSKNELPTALFFRKLCIEKLRH